MFYTSLHYAIVNSNYRNIILKPKQVKCLEAIYVPFLAFVGGLTFDLRPSRYFWLDNKYTCVYLVYPESQHFYFLTQAQWRQKPYHSAPPSDHLFVICQNLAHTWPDPTTVSFSTTREEKRERAWEGGWTEACWVQRSSHPKKNLNFWGFQLEIVQVTFITAMTFHINMRWVNATRPT